MQQFEVSEILWDNWGIPHIYAKNEVELFHAMGWAQAKSHGNLILMLYGQARGRAAEYWGSNYVDTDRYVRTMGIPRRAQEWYEAQSDKMRTYLKAFADGINGYIQAYPDEIPEFLKVVLPISSVDILAHIQRVIHFFFVVNPNQIAALTQGEQMAGSNAWAIAPEYSASQKAMLLVSPHQPWFDLFLWYEVQLTLPNLNAYGAALVGWPTLGIAFNDYLGWTVTVNPTKGADFYELHLRDRGYEWNDEICPFVVETQTLKIKQEDGSLLEEPLVVLQSVHGPVVAQTESKAIVLRVVGLDRPYLLEQMWEMINATNLSQFEASLQRLQLPLFNFLYADTDGQIFYLFNALVPVRSQSSQNQEDWDYWQKVIPGNTSDTLWTQYHSYQDLPRVVNPPSGWLQNTNDPPWTVTFPTLLQPEDYSPYIAPSNLGKMPHNILRPQRSIQKLLSSDTISFEDMVAFMFSSRLELADRILDGLIASVKTHGREQGMEAVKVLEAWDRHANADSRGTVLFIQWVQKMGLDKIFATPWQSHSPLDTPCGLIDPVFATAVLEEVAEDIQSRYGMLDIAWGEVVRLRVGNQDLPASGTGSIFGSFQVLDIIPVDEKNFQAIGGNSFMMAIEFTNPIRAEALTIYGNATQPHSPHVADQLSLYIRGQMRPVWRTQAAIADRLMLREILDLSSGLFVQVNG